MHRMYAYVHYIHSYIMYTYIHTFIHTYIHTYYIHVVHTRIKITTLLLFTISDCVYVALTPTNF